ncbi:HAMP domain-containing histidine kinase [Phototrophicus methaneseepsis]|uniref:histidine kinase n=1 Tax=Phototrophicus methaneseepsis TaxID=2710758 RepID=A0A7S8E8G1_9CHLR|nr:HAMP domain-containing sensor histidine kinase [Phototrophicus methaneseepsis]QPC82280.1 HAMP domain-containing histidine kinase [Phototrophicus methaneseepsis]
MFGRMRLRTQLLATYILLLIISLSVISVAALVLVGVRPAPNESSYNRFASIMQGLGVRNFLSGVTSTPGVGNGNGNREARMQEMVEQMGRYAEYSDVRVMWAYSRSGETLVLYDSMGVYETGDSIVLHVDKDYVEDRELQSYLTRNARQYYGDFQDPDGTEWLYGGVAALGLQRLAPARYSEAASIMLVAEPRPTVTLQTVLGEFSRALLPPLLQAALVGLIVSVVLALLVSRGIARPLQSLAKAADEVARNKIHEQVPESGPREIRAVAKSFNQMSAEVRASQEAQRDFLANVSHDLKTPLTSIQGYSQSIMDGVAKDPAAAAQIIYDEAGRLNRMVVELTDLARMQAGRLSMKMNALDVGEIAAAVGQRLSVVARKKNIDLQVETGPMPHIAGDGDRLAQVFTNLLSNAIKFTPEGGTVVLKTRTRNDGVEIIVQDSGIGIATEDLNRVFERFYQVDKARGPKRGTGLGLAIVREIVQAHGGTISVSSDGPNQGTTFTIWLPSPQLSTLLARRDLMGDS